MNKTIKVEIASNVEKLWENFLEGTKDYFKSTLGDICAVEIDYPYTESGEEFDPGADEDHVCLQSSVTPDSNQEKKVCDFQIKIRFDRDKKRKSSCGGIYFSFDVGGKDKYVRISKIEFDISILEEEKLLKEFRSFLSTGSVRDEYYFLHNLKILALHEAEKM